MTHSAGRPRPHEVARDRNRSRATPSHPMPSGSHQGTLSNPFQPAVLSLTEACPPPPHAYNDCNEGVRAFTDTSRSLASVRPERHIVGSWPFDFRLSAGRTQFQRWNRVWAGDHESPISREMLAEVTFAVLSFRPLRGRRRPGYSAGSPWRRAMLPSPASCDTSSAAAEIQRQQIRHLSPLERLRKGCALSNRGRRLAMEAIRRRYPAANGEEVRLRFIELAYGPSLAREVRCWLDRPAS